MSEERYLEPFPGGRWAISRKVGSRWIYLIENSSLNEPGDAEVILQALTIDVSPENLDRYFPDRGSEGRCPTLELMELCNVLDPMNTFVANKNRKTKESGV